MSFTKDEINLVFKRATELDVDPNFLLAVIMQESAGEVFGVSEYDNPKRAGSLALVRWEGHYFDKLVNPKKREQARAAKLASPKVGGIKNPASQVKRWQMIWDAAEIDHDAAYMSASYGFGQIMGAGWKELGYASVDALVSAANAGFSYQLDMMIRFIKSKELIDELQTYNLAGFFRAYNGPKWESMGYGEGVAKKYKALTGEDLPKGETAGMLRLGSKGAKVLEVQRILARENFYKGKLDSDYGESTKKAVMAFQSAKGITPVDGVVGPVTERALSTLKAPSEDLTKTPITENRDVKGGAGIAAGGLTLGSGGQALQGAADKISGSGIPFFDYVAYGLYTASALLVVGGIAYGIYGYLKAKRTS